MKEALKLALEALEANQPVNYCMNSNGERFPMMHEDPFRFDRNTKAITAIKEALAQPEQEPVAWKETDEVECPVCRDKGFPWPKCGHITYLERTTPPQRQPEERNFCPRCGKRTADLTTIHTCTPPRGNTRATEYWFKT